MPFTFCKSDRLLKRREFVSFSGKSHQYFGTSIIIQWRKTGTAKVRLGITAPKKFGSAVRRNRFKRLVREAFRLFKEKPLIGLDLNIHPRRGAECVTLSCLLEDFAKFFETQKMSPIPRVQ
jgi:ribonuclease P protein component